MNKNKSYRVDYFLFILDPEMTFWSSKMDHEKIECFRMVNRIQIYKKNPSKNSFFRVLVSIFIKHTFSPYYIITTFSKKNGKIMSSLEGLRHFSKKNYFPHIKFWLLFSKKCSKKHRPPQRKCWWKNVSSPPVGRI